MILTMVKFRVPARVNQIPPVAQGLQQVKRLEWDWQEAQSASDPMESIRPQTSKAKQRTQNKQDENELKAKDKKIKMKTNWKWNRNEANKMRMKTKWTMEYMECMNFNIKELSANNYLNLSNVIKIIEYNNRTSYCRWQFFMSCSSIPTPPLSLLEGGRV